jgi:hypothetical protein
MSKEAPDHGSGLSRLEKNQLMNPTICPLRKEEGAHYRSADASSNPTKVGEPDFTGKYREVGIFAFMYYTICIAC